MYKCIIKGSVSDRNKLADCYTNPIADKEQLSVVNYSILADRQERS